MALWCARVVEVEDVGVEEVAGFGGCAVVGGMLQVVGGLSCAVVGAELDVESAFGEYGGALKYVFSKDVCECLGFLFGLPCKCCSPEHRKVR